MILLKRHGCFEQHNMLRLDGDLLSVKLWHNWSMHKREGVTGSRGEKGSDLDPSTVSFSKVNEQCWEMGEWNSTHKRNQQSTSGYSLSKKNIHTQLFNGLTKPLSKMGLDSDELLHLFLHWQALDLNSTSEQKPERNLKGVSKFFFTLGFRKDNARHSQPLLHWASHFPSPWPQFLIWKSE